MRDLEARADGDLVVHEVRAAAGFLHAPYADLVGIELVRRAQQGVGVAMHARAPRRASLCMTTTMCEPPEKAGMLPPPTGASLKCLISGVSLLDGDDLDGKGLLLAHRAAFTEIPP
jgi:hypothetical protein